MGHGLEENRPIGPLNMDDEVRDIGPNESLYNLNVRNAINAANKGKSLTNVLGNLQIIKYVLPYSNNVFPGGTNRCIGAVEDTKYNTIVFFVYNSNSNHQILRYYRNNTDPQNPYGEVQQVMLFDFGWTRSTRITSINFAYGTPNPNTEPGQSDMGDLLYWCDPEPRKINLTKGNICYKQKSWTLYAPNTYNSFQAAGNFGFELNDYLGANIVTVSINVPIQPDNTTGLKFIANAINANYASKLSAEACDCSITITEKGTNAFTYQNTGQPLFMVPENWYGDQPDDRFFDHCKWLDMQAPQPRYADDPHFLPNYVSNKVFQFRLQYKYDDLEQAVPGVWSQIAINNIQCDGTSAPLANYIDVDFNDTTLIDPLTIIILKKITFIARELNTGPDRAVFDMEPCDFLDYDGTHWFCHFKFYNDVVSDPVDEATAALLFDDVPLQANAELIVKDRMVFGGTLNGYNPPECPELKLNVKINEVASKKLYKVTFKIRICTYGLNFAEQSASNGGFFDFFPTAHKYPFWQPQLFSRGGVFHDTSRTPTSPGGDWAYWGGGSYGAGSNPYGQRAGMETTWDQRAPEGGFPVYTAGEPYFGISRQISVGLPTDGNNALDTSSSTNIAAIGKYFGGYPDAEGNVVGDIYSTVTIMVPEGQHVFRVASSWCSFGDVLGKGYAYDLNGRLYQKTSTNVMGWFTPGGQWQSSKEIVIDVTGDVGDAGTFVIMDVSPPVDANMTPGSDHIDEWQPLGIYLLDGTANPLGQGNTDMNSATYEGVAIEKAAIGYSSLSPKNGGNYSNWTGWEDCCTTDHNGFWFGINSGGAGPYLPNINAYEVGGALNTIPNVSQIITDSNTVWIGTLTDVLNKTLQDNNFSYNGGSTVNAVQLISGAITAAESDTREACSTFIKGRVIDQHANAVNGVTVIYTEGKTGKTDINGQYEIVAWGDMVQPNLLSFSQAVFSITSSNNRTVDGLIFIASPLCNITYPNGQQILNVMINFFGGNPYSPTNPILIADFVISELLFSVVKCLKRGGNYQVGPRFYDDPGRLCSVTGPFNLYIPFETEDLSLYPYVLQANNTPYPPGSYVEGQPIIEWAWAAGSVPPQWAATVQLMRTQKTNYSTFFRWVINAAQYVSQLANAQLGTPALNTSYNNGDAVAVLLDISNTVVYNGQNPGASLGYSWTQGDRVRFIFDRNNTLLQSPSVNLGQTGQMLDFPITGTYTPAVGNPNQLIVPVPELPFEVMSGFTIEIYTPKDLVNVSEQIYYEVGEVFKCTNPGQANNRFVTLSGTFTNGDTYWRGRLIQVDDAVNNFSGVFPALVEDPSLSDLYPSMAEDIGRPGTIDPDFLQIFQPSYMRATDTFLPSTAYNGLSRLPAAAELVLEKTLDRKYGQIRRLFFEQNNLVAIMTSKEVSNYINRQTIYNAQNPNGIQAQSSDFFGTEFVHENNFGTDLPGSCVTNSGNIFGWTNQRANYWRYMSNGETAISDQKMISFFKQLSIDGVSDAVAVYDRYHEELIVTYLRNQQEAVVVSTAIKTETGFVISFPFAGALPPVGANVAIQYLLNGVWVTLTGAVTSNTGGNLHVSFTVAGALPVRVNDTINLLYTVQETLSWFEGTKDMKLAQQSGHWITFYSYLPEWMCALNSEIFSWVDGRIWIHDKNPLYNNFYGVQYATIVTPVFNEEPKLVKVWNALWMMSFQDNGACDWFSNNISNSNGQLSRLKKANWQQEEENWYTTFLRDQNDTVATVPIVNGRYLRSTSLTCQMTNDYTGEVTLYGWQANFSLSERTSK